MVSQGGHQRPIGHAERDSWQEDSWVAEPEEGSHLSRHQYSQVEG
jgi:hypothetical protein